MAAQGKFPDARPRLLAFSRVRSSGVRVASLSWEARELPPNKVLRKKKGLKRLSSSLAVSLLCLVPFSSIGSGESGGETSQSQGEEALEGGRGGRQYLPKNENRKQVNQEPSKHVL